MTKKDYILLAQAFNEAKDQMQKAGHSLDELQQDAIIDTLVAYMIEDNKRFDTSRFVEAMKQL